MIRAFGLALAAAPLVVGASLHAQCPDGSPPPCEVAARRAAVRPAPPPAAERGRSFLVLPFRNVTGAADYQWLVEGSPTLLGEALSQWQELRVVSEERMYPALRRHGIAPGDLVPEDQLRRLAEATGGWTAVTGEVLATGNRLRVSARATDVVTGRVVVRAAEEASRADDIRTAYARLAGRLLQSAGLEAAALDLPAATTQSLEAYKAYVAGVAYLNRGEYRRARESFEEAVQRDTAFAQAYAKLAESSMTSARDLLDPQSRGYRMAQRALALSSRLPPRDRTAVQGVAAMFQGQLGQARAAFEQLVAADSGDIDALQNLAGLEGFDPILVGRAGAERPRGSRNAAVRLAKRVSELDPSRVDALQGLAWTYAQAAGLNGGVVGGYRREAGSLGALFSQVPDRIFTVLLRDTLELIPVDSLGAWPRDSVAAARARALAAADAWAARWIAAAPGSGQAHDMAATIHELGGRLDAAVAELQIAESLGIEIEASSLGGRRLVLLGKLRRFDLARSLADSLVDAGFFAQPRAGLWNHGAWAVQVELLAGQFARAEAILGQLGRMSAAAGAGTDSARASANIVCAMLCFISFGSGVSPVDVPEAFRLEVLDSVFRRLEDVPRGGLMAQHFFSRILAARNLSPETEARLLELLRAAVPRAAATRPDLAVRLVIPVTERDTSRAGRQAALAALKQVVASAPEERRALYELGRFGVITGTELALAERSLRRYLEQPPPAGAPSHAAAHWRLGQLAERRGDRRAAVAEYEAATRLDPSDADFRAALERLRRN